MARAAVEFEVYRQDSLIVGGGSWRWRARAKNGRIVADGGEGYSSKSAAVKAVERLILQIATDQVRILEPS